MTEMTASAGWRTPSEHLYEWLGRTPTFWLDVDDGLLCWVPLQGGTPIFDKAAMRHNAIVLGKRRGYNPADEPPPQITVRRGGIQFGGAS